MRAALLGWMAFFFAALSSEAWSSGRSLAASSFFPSWTRLRNFFSMTLALFTVRRLFVRLRKATRARLAADLVLAIRTRIVS